MAPPYPTPAQIKQIFDSRVDQSVFNSHLADNISIIIVGHNSPFVGHYKSVQHFDEAVYARMAATLKMETAKVEVVQVIGGGESASAAVESVVTGTSKLGEFVYLHVGDVSFFLSFDRASHMMVMFSLMLMMMRAGWGR